MIEILNQYIIVAELKKVINFKRQCYCKIFSNDVDELNQIKKFYYKSNNEFFQLPKIFFEKKNNKIICSQKNKLDNSKENYIIKNKEIYANKIDFPILKKGEYYILDLMKCQCFFKRNIIGNILNIINYGSCDLFYLKNLQGKNYYIPFLNQYIYKINLKKKIIVFKNIEGFFDI